MFQVSPHGNLPIPSEDDYNNINPVTYEGIFYQEQEDFGHFDLEPVDLEDLGNDVETRGESVVNLHDISMLEKLHTENDNDDEPTPFDENPDFYSKDSDSENENENENDSEYLFFNAFYFVFVLNCFLNCIMPLFFVYTFYYVFVLNCFLLLNAGD